MKTFLKKVVLFVAVLLVVSGAGFLLSGGVARGETEPGTILAGDMGIDFEPDYKTIQGQGFFITSKVIVTAWHVVKNKEMIVFQAADGRWFLAELLGWNEAADTALLGSPFVSSRAYGLNPWIFNGMPVYYFSRGRNAVSRGVLQPSPNWFRDRLLVVGDPVVQGDSGMPVFDAYNNLCIGMEVAVVKKNFNQLLLVPAATIQSIAVQLGAWQYMKSSPNVIESDIMNPIVKIYAR